MTFQYFIDLYCYDFILAVHYMDKYLNGRSDGAQGRPGGPAAVALP